MAHVFAIFNTDTLNQTLIKLNDQLSSSNVLQLSFLCKDACDRDFEDYKDPIDLFRELRSYGYLKADDVSYLAEILWRIGRKDLVKRHLVTDVLSYEKYVDNHTHISEYRLMLHELCENMVDRSFKAMKLYLVNCVSKKELDRLEEPQQMFVLMEKRDMLGPKQDHRMIAIVEGTQDPHLCDVLVRYGKHQPQQSQHQPQQLHKQHRAEHHQNHHHTPQHYTHTTGAHQYGIEMSQNPFAYMHQNEHNGAQMNEMNRSVEGMKINARALQSYKMNAKPRGYCVIINNINFHVTGQHPHQAKLLKTREGGENDLALLTDTWQKLNFEVLVYNDVEAQNMTRIMTHMGMEKDHTNYDMFVCCVLTHGANNQVYGSDGLPVKVKDLINPVKPVTCKSLIDKPKVFFVQACQGKDKQEGHAISSDIETDYPSEQEFLSINESSVPNEADILLSYATVPGFVSYRSKSTGSFYVKALCECLNEHAHKYDLMSILIEVNNKVSQMTADLDDGIYKQVPQPQMTLRKAIFFE